MFGIIIKKRRICSPDSDNDKYPSSPITNICGCNSSATDCNDNDAAYHPGATENYGEDYVDPDYNCDGIVWHAEIIESETFYYPITPPSCGGTLVYCDHWSCQLAVDMWCKEHGYLGAMYGTITTEWRVENIGRWDYYFNRWECTGYNVGGDRITSIKCITGYNWVY